MQPLHLKTGSIWAALNIDFPFHSFSHIGIDYGNLLPFAKFLFFSGLIFTTPAC
ncbi:hypothetical protein VP01_719g3 [Puccinia sorghi]|uniref:Uncharacterized protein n=1 Tax=Puccinia sorghi TaxID=27349 RepID=A0A0L6UD91_9BASI|nr:hypothetical protein VP01_719g3 [Puccinia sorghi]